VVADVLPVLGRQPSHLFWWRHGIALRREKLEFGLDRAIEKLRPDRARQNLRDERWNRVPELALHLGAPTIDRKTIGERLDAAHLLEGETSVFPMKRPNRGTGLGLHGP